MICQNCKKKKLAKLKGIDCFVQLMKEKINKIKTKHSTESEDNLKCIKIYY